MQSILLLAQKIEIIIDYNAYIIIIVMALSSAALLSGANQNPLVNLPPQSYVLFVGPDADNLQPYIWSQPTIRNGRVLLNGMYYGSSTRLGPLGTVFNIMGQHVFPLNLTPVNPQGKHLRVMRDNDMILDIFVTGQEFMNHDDMYRIVHNGIIIMLRDLHRFNDYPVEISGISFPVPQ
jgi:hypothetical protein